MVESRILNQLLPVRKASDFEKLIIALLWGIPSYCTKPKIAKRPLEAAESFHGYTTKCYR